MSNAPNRPQAMDAPQVWLVDAMVQAGWRQVEIAEHFNVSTDTVRAISKRTGAYKHIDHYAPDTPAEVRLHAAMIGALKRRAERHRHEWKAQRKEQAA